MVFCPLGGRAGVELVRGFHPLRAEEEPSGTQGAPGYLRGMTCRQLQGGEGLRPQKQNPPGFRRAGDFWRQLCPWEWIVKTLYQTVKQ